MFISVCDGGVERCFGNVEIVVEADGELSTTRNGHLCECVAWRNNLISALESSICNNVLKLGCEYCSGHVFVSVVVMISSSVLTPYNSYRTPMTVHRPIHHRCLLTSSKMSSTFALQVRSHSHNDEFPI